MPEDKEISGRVVDEKGSGIPYATVYLKGTKEGTSCDSTGFFKLNISCNDTVAVLSASCIGYSSKEKEVNIGKNKFAEIILSSKITTNSEVVVISYGSVMGKMTTGAITIVRRSYLQKIKEFFIKDSVNVYPNPAKAGSVIKVQWTKAGGGEYTIELYNLQGQVIKTTTERIETETTSFDFHLPLTTPGTYILRFTNKITQKNHTEKIVIQ